jgi:hypothetical protein
LFSAYIHQGTHFVLLIKKYQFMMHATLDHLEELLGSKTNTLARWQRGSNYIGSICSMEDCEIYAYVTSSNIKILAMIQNDGVIPLVKTRESDIRVLFAKVHDCYVKYTMNPFTKVRSKIEQPCLGFDQGVLVAVTNYNKAVQERVG